MDDDRWGLLTLVILVRFFDYPVSMIGLTHGVRSNTLPPSAALLVLGIWQCGAMLLLENMANRWLARPAAWLGVVIANSVVLTVYLWNMSAVVLAAVRCSRRDSRPNPRRSAPRGGGFGPRGSSRVRSA